MKLIVNQTNDDISIVIDGTKHSVDANSSTPVSDKVAERWTKTHEFLAVEDYEEKAPKEKREPQGDSAEEPSELVVETPKKETKKFRAKASSKK